MTSLLNTRCRNMVLGALVAGGAAMGLHWIYDQSHIRKLAPQNPEFRTPDAADYQGVPGYFAHPTRAAGALSQYGEQTLVMLRMLSHSNGIYRAADYAAQFRQHFGYGGAYVGYIDHATRDTLDNFRRFDDAAKACADALPFEGEPRVKAAVLAKVQALLNTHNGAAFDTAVRDSFPDENAVQFAAALAPVLAALPRATGAADLQLPATAKLPALVAALVAHGLTEGHAFADPVASAIRITNNHPVAADYGMICANMMRSALLDGSVEAALTAAHASASPESLALLNTAKAMRAQDNTNVTRHFGMACDLPFGVPSAVHNIATAPSFADAVRRNIYAGGDTCGRAIVVGAVLGAVHGIGGAQGIPPEWISTLTVADEVTETLARLFV